jgi:hypothetical protein
MEPTTNAPIPMPKPPQDLSPRVVELARVIDRLPPGTSVIVLRKEEVRAMDWSVEVLSVQHSTSMTLPKRSSAR